MSNSTGPAQFLVAGGDWATINFKHGVLLPIGVTFIQEILSFPNIAQGPCNLKRT